MKKVPTNLEFHKAKVYEACKMLILSHLSQKVNKKTMKNGAKKHRKANSSETVSHT